MIVSLRHAAVLRFSAPSVSVFSVCVLKHMIHIVFPVVSLSLRSVTLSSRLPGGEETGLGSSDGKVGQRSQPSTGELLKRPGEMMSWTLFLFSSPPPLCFFPSLPPSCSSGEARQQETSQSFGRARHAHHRNTRHWWLHRAEIRPPSIRKPGRLVMKDRISRIGSYTALLCGPPKLSCYLYFRVSQLQNCDKVPFIGKSKSRNEEEMQYHIAEVVFCKLRFGERAKPFFYLDTFRTHRRDLLHPGWRRPIRASQTH